MQLALKNWKKNKISLLLLLFTLWKIVNAPVDTKQHQMIFIADSIRQGILCGGWCGFAFEKNYDKKQGHCFWRCANTTLVFDVLALTQGSRDFLFEKVD